MKVCIKKVSLVLAQVLSCAVFAQSGNGLQKYVCDSKVYVPFDSSTVVTLECPDAAARKWLEDHFQEWYGRNAPKVESGKCALSLPEGDEAYAASTSKEGVRIAANTIAGVRWASYSLRQLAIAKRGTFKTEGHILPELSLSDCPHLAFRAIHLCWFPETRPQQIERSIRLAAMLKFNYVIIEPWGTYKSKKFPWRSWPKAAMTKAEVDRLVAIGKDIGVTLIPQINCYGHASFSRSISLKHSALELNPEYEPLFEPDGWNWCLSNPETQRVLREMIAELHENFGNPPFVHIGCDEANAMGCPECLKTPAAELVGRHIAGLASFIKSRGAQAMMWHDMLLDKNDSRWKDFVKNGTKEFSETVLGLLPKDIVICDWQYSYCNMNETRTDWPTVGYFLEKGYPVVGCPWKNYNSMKPMADYIARRGGFGIVETTWHQMHGDEWSRMFMNSAAAAWGSPVTFGVSFQRMLRLIGRDMKIAEYEDTGHSNYQIPPSWWNW